ncbi:hypothetical protein ACLB2K_015367 [Fragaria x ananassa]
MYVTLTWAISLLLNHPHVLEKAQEELDTEVGRERTVAESDLSKLVYLQAIVKETSRLYPVAPLAPHNIVQHLSSSQYIEASRKPARDLESFNESQRWRRSRLAAPQAKGAWPILGHLPLLGGSTPPQIILGAMADKYGPLFTVRLGVYPTLVVSSSEVAKECFTIHDMAASSRPKMAAAELMAYNNAMFGLAPYGPYWRELRKLATLKLLSNRQMQLLKDIRVSEVATFLKELFKLTDHNHVALVELKQWFGDLTLNVTLRMVAGKRYSFISDSTNEDEKKEGGRVQDAVRKFFYFSGVFMVGDLVPYLRWLDLGGHEKAMKKTAKEIDAIIEEWLQEHKQRRRAAGDVGEHDFMDAMLTELHGADLGGYDADTVNKAACLVRIY